MLQPAENQKAQTSPRSISYAPANGVNSTLEQATIGRSLVIKGEVTGAESLYIDGKIEGSINVPEHRVTIGRHGIVTANIAAREVVVMGKVNGNIQCNDRIDIRSEGSLTGDVVAQRISMEDGAIMKGSIQVQAAEKSHNKEVKAEQPKAMGVAAGA